MKRFYLLLALSLLFHLAQLLLLNLAPGSSYLEPHSETVIELVDQTSEVKNAIAEKKIISVPKSVLKIANEEPAKFFSDEDQRVQKQTAVRNYGMTNNQQLNAQNSKNKKQNLKTESGDEPEFAKAVRSGAGTTAPSAMQIQLPSDIADGTATNLNTDAHIYASFYNRVTDLFYIRWIQRLDAIWERLPKDAKDNLSGRVWSTDLEIWLNDKGEYAKSFIMKPSGFQTFDNAAVFAFQNAKFFPNPPRAKVEADGFVRLRYRISVNVR